MFFSFRNKKHVLIAVGVLFGLALATPALVFARGFDGGIKWGAECFILGWLYVPAMRPGWIANVPLVAGVVTFALDKFRAAAALGLGAVDEKTILSPPFLHPHVGFYLWIASMLTLAIGALANARAKRSAICSGGKPWRSSR